MSAEDKQQFDLTIQRVRDGGYLVRECPEPNFYRQEIFACTSIDECLAFVKRKFGGENQ